MSGGNSPLAILSGPGKIQDKPKQLKAVFDTWVKTQPPYIEGLSAGFFGAFQGAFLGTLMGYMTKNTADQAASGAPLAPPPPSPLLLPHPRRPAPHCPPPPLAAMPGAQMMQMGGPLQQARNFAVMTGVNAGVNTFMRRRRGVDDVQNTVVAGFVSGACFSLASGMGATSTTAIPGSSPNPLMGAFSAGVVFALFQGGFYKLGEAFGGPKTDDVEYARVKAMLGHLGLAKYEKNVKKALLNDATLMLWDASALQEANVPAGPRLLILHHIDTYRNGPAGKVRDLLNPAIPLRS